MSDTRSARIAKLNIYKVFHTKSKTEDFVDLPIGPHQSLIRYQYDAKNPSDDSKKLKGTFSVISFYRQVTTSFAPEWIVGKFFNGLSSETEMDNEAIHTAINLGWVAHNFEVLTQKAVLFQPLAEGNTFVNTLFDKPSAYFAAGSKITDAVIAFHHDDHIHRDLQSLNIMIDPNSLKVTLIDCGLTQFKKEMSFIRERIAHQPPELPRQSIPMREEIDIFGLGDALYRQYFVKLKMHVRDNNFISQRFLRLCSEMKAFNPSDRLPLTQVKKRLEDLEQLAKLAEDEKISIKPDDAVKLFPNIKTFLEFHFSLSTTHQMRLINFLGEKGIRQIITDNNLRRFLTEKDLKEMDLPFLKDILKFYPSYLHHSLLEKIGLDKIQKTNDLLKEATPLIFDEVRLGEIPDFLQKIETLFHLFFGRLKKSLAKEIIRPWKIKWIQEDYRFKAITNPSCFDVLEDKTTLDQTAIDQINRSTLHRLLQRIIEEQEEHLPLKLFSSLRKKYFDLITSVESNTDSTTLKNSIVGLAVSSCFLDHQYELGEPDFDKDNTWGQLLKCSFTRFEDFLEFDLDLAPMNRSDFLRRLDHLYYAKIYQQFRQLPHVIENTSFMNRIFNHYLYSSYPFSNFILNSDDLISLIKIYPSRSRLQLLQKVGIEHIRGLLQNSRVEFRRIFELLPAQDNRVFAKHFESIFTVSTAPQSLFTPAYQKTIPVLTPKEQGLTGRAFVK